MQAPLILFKLYQINQHSKSNHMAKKKKQKRNPHTRHTPVLPLRRIKQRLVLKYFFLAGPNSVRVFWNFRFIVDIAIFDGAVFLDKSPVAFLGSAVRIVYVAVVEVEGYDFFGSFAFFVFASLLKLFKGGCEGCES